MNASAISCDAPFSALFPSSPWTAGNSELRELDLFEIDAVGGANLAEAILAGAGAAGLIGSFFGPAGGLAGAVIGGVAGGLAYYIP